MSNAEQDAADFCYRHPDRPSYVLCQRCGKTICPECQNQAAVGVHCPDCVRQARQGHPRQKPAVLRAFSSTSDRPVVTYSIIGITVLVYLLQFVFGNAVTGRILYVPVLTYVEPWRMITSMFAHANIFHLAINMYLLFLLGPTLEHFLGRARFTVLYFLTGLGGGVLVLLIGANNVLGASGAIFGLFGAYFMIQRRMGGNTTQIVVIVALNFVIGFFLPLISWQAHLGGVLTGVLLAYIFLHTRKRSQASAQTLLVVAVGLGLVAATTLPLFVPWVPIIL